MPGSTARVLKGPALAHLDYPSPGMRPFVHVNLLVRAEQFVEAIQLLIGAPATAVRTPSPHAGFDARFRKGTDLVSASGTRVEVHRTIADGPYAMIVEHSRTVQGFDSGRSRSPDTELAALGPEERLLHACFEARVGDTKPLLVRLRDIVQLVLTHDLDIKRIEHLSGAWGAQSLVAEAVRRAWTLLGVTDMVQLSAWAATHPDEPQGAQAATRLSHRAEPDPHLGSDTRCDPPATGGARIPESGRTARSRIPRRPLPRTRESLVASGEIARAQSSRSRPSCA